jgi:hypothetical protein
LESPSLFCLSMHSKENKAEQIGWKFKMIFIYTILNL